MNIDVIKCAIDNSTKDSSVYVGCDSFRKGKNVTYVTTVVIHYDSNRGAAIFKKVEKEKYIGFYPRLQGEVYRAANLGLIIKDLVDGRHFEIHLDINPSPLARSNVVYKEAKGAIKGIVGIEAKFKPDAFAASFAADRFCKG